MALLENERVDAIDNDEEFANELRESVKETGLPYAPDGIINIDHVSSTCLLVLTKNKEGRLCPKSNFASDVEQSTIDMITGIGDSS